MRFKSRNRRRDSKGRFVSKKKYAFVDEFGNGGPFTNEKERYFGYVVTVTDKPHAFGRLSRVNRRRYTERTGKTTEELKANKDVIGNKYRITRDIRRLDPDVRAYYIDKKSDVPRGWDTERDGTNNRVRPLDYVIKETLKDHEGDMEFVVDGQDNLKKGVVSDVCEKYNGRRTVTGGTYNSKKGKYADHLQTQDYVTNATRSKLIGFPFKSHPLHSSYFFECLSLD